MCGFIGSFSGNFIDEEICQKMTETLVHRGPDDSGVWVDKNAGIALGHRRLAIQDLSPEGHQPMESSSRRYVIAYNGEIYNFLELKKELEISGASFRGHSDTEVLLEAIEQWGIQESLMRCVGMFSFALWDKHERTLSLARDRMGEKPLYYGWQGTSFLFASELKALRVHPDWQGTIDRDSLTLLMRYNYIPAPHSVYQGIQKLMPGTFLQINAKIQRGELPQASSYWEAKSIIEAGDQNPFTGSETDAVNALDELLSYTIREKMISDVPLGAFLSGGIDSSSIVALMQANSSRRVKTFSIGFHEEGYNEAKYAKAVAHHLGTDHTELYVTPEQAIAVIPKLPHLYDEPFSDSSQIPTFLVSEMTRNHVTVALSGDGGDELFGGYNRYLWGETIWNQMSKVPLPIRCFTSKGIQSITADSWNRIYELFTPLIPTRFKQALFGDKLHKLAKILSVETPEAMYQSLVSHWHFPEQLVLNACEPETALTNQNRRANLSSFIQRMMFLDMVSYLPGDILAKVDRAAMGVSLETRIPFLDHRVIEFASKIPMSLKIRNNQGKWILRQVLYRYVPSKLIERPKMGFGIPLDSWIRGPLREWAEELLNEKRLYEEGFFNPIPIRQKWKEHVSGIRNWQYLLWNVLMFQAWLEQETYC